MVALSIIQASNSLMKTALPAGLVAVFIGATSGIGEISVKTFAKHANKPRVYIVGRSQDAADQILAECYRLNPLGEFHFIRSDVSLLRNVEKLCAEINAKEKSLNLLFLSAGQPSLDRAQTPEKLHLIAALNYYSRIRIIANLLPLLQRASSLRRIVTVGGGTKEGKLHLGDLQANDVPLPEIRGHLTSLVTLGLEAVARSVPDISIIHDYPGTVKTPFLDHIPEEMLRNVEFVPLDECGERHVYLATSAEYPPRDGKEAGIPLQAGVQVSVGSNGQVGSGLYSINQDGESAGLETLKLLAHMRSEGSVDRVWEHTDGEFKRILGEDAQA